MVMRRLPLDPIGADTSCLVDSEHARLDPIGADTSCFVDSEHARFEHDDSPLRASGSPSFVPGADVSDRQLEPSGLSM